MEKKIPVISSISELEKYTDSFCLDIVEELYNKNIRVLSSNIGSYDKYNGTSGIEIKIVIDFNSLSDENKKVVAVLVKNILAVIDNNVVTIIVPVNKKFTAGDITQAFNTINDCFKMQDVKYGIYTYEQLRDIICKHHVLDPYKFNNEYIGEFKPDIYFDKETSLYYENEELYNKHINYLKTIQTTEKEL